MRVHSCAVLVIGCAAVLSAASAQAVLVGADLYVNPLAAATSASFGRVGDPGVVWSDNGAMSRAFDGGMGAYNHTDANKYTSYANDGPTFFRWQMPSGSFTARTFITQQGASYPFNAASPYQLSVNSGGGGSFVDVAGQQGPGLGSTSPFVVTSNSQPIIGSAVEVNFATLLETGGLGFALMQEIIAVEDELTRLTLSSGSASSSLGGYFVTSAFDNQAHVGWASATSNPGESLTVNLAAPSDLGAILITGVDARSEQFDIYLNGSLTPTVTGVEWVGDTNSAFLKLDAPVEDVTSITLLFTNSPVLLAAPAVHYIGEIIPFTVEAIEIVPEPATWTLLGMGVLGLVWRTRRRG